MDNLTGLSARGRYLRVYGTRRASTFGYSLYEVEVFGKAGGITAVHSGATEAADALRLYPNPAETELYLTLAGTARIQALTVVDVLGQTVLRSAAPNALLSIAALPAGLYVVRVTTTDRRQLSQRFTKR